MTLSDSPASLEDLLRDAVLSDGPLAEVLTAQLTRLLGAIEEITYGTSIDVARARGDVRPDQEATMARGNALSQRLKGIFHGRRGAGKPAGADPATQPVPQVHSAQPPEEKPRPSPEEKPRPSPVARTGALDRRQMDVRVERMLQSFADSSPVHAALGAEPLHGRTIAQQWTSFHLGLLRLPRAQADDWREQVRDCIPEEYLKPTAGWWELCADIPAPTVLVPAYHDQPGVVAWQEALPDKIVESALGDRVHTYHRLAAIASQVLWVAAQDKSALYATKAGLVPAQAALTDFQQTLRERLTTYRSAESGPAGKTVVVRAAQLAEVLRSVVHQPSPAPESWWAGVRTEMMTFVRQTAIRHAPNLRVKEISVREVYADLANNKEVDPDDDIALHATDRADVGRIFDCLKPSLLEDHNRVYRPGRVIYGGEGR
ncbi:hypothetical protein BJY16_007133 [Actinoplanes octamycinicus]|uniref:Uncharacterized protein n=1 Tax=Actinoplanes octamycinicus TaxID=135948 RepID=A0A7W7MB23_9ACTN|nr:hypothetical protein [Actinoplanes octamycinicus]MBB4743674.1 hypothetical protein [Actinoplanes octamycinicus]GIE61100.1 hypothetical protein Aoc01nite_65020 [Actinoplanes octamycinicus]